MRKKEEQNGKNGENVDFGVGWASVTQLTFVLTNNLFPLYEY